MRRALRAAGVVGPLGFVAAWALGGARTPHYSPVQDAISDLAAVGAPMRGLMTAGFVCFGVALPIYAIELRDRFGGAAWLAAATSGVFTLGVALVPLGRSATSDAVHGVLAGAGYVSLALTPLLATRALAQEGRPRAAAASISVGVVAGLCLAATVIGPAHGLLQRAGLTLVDAWLIVTALAGRTRSA